MSETKWTPGPWQIARYTNYEGFSISADNAGCIAERWWPSRAFGIPIEANAHLIAAAPDLYEALEAIDQNWGIGGFTGPEDPRAQDRFTDRTIAAWHKIRAALAKARGEA